MTRIKKLEAPVIIDVSAEDEDEEILDEIEEWKLWKERPTKQQPVPYELERWRAEQKSYAVLEFLGTTDRAFNEILNTTLDLPWFLEEPLLHQYVEQHPSKQPEKLREAFQRAEDGALLLFEAKQKDYDVELHLHPPLSDWKSFFQSADAWKETLRGLSQKTIITLWNYYLIEAVYAFDFQRENPCGFVFTNANKSDATWTIWDDEKMERIPQRGKLEDAVMSAVDKRALSGYLAMRALDLNTMTKLAQDATRKFEEELLHEG